MGSNEESNFQNMLKVYYSRLFPKKHFYNWLCYGDRENFDKREISFTLAGDIYIRYLSFPTLEEFGTTLCRRLPIKIDIGALHNVPLGGRRLNYTAPIERELVFDIDMTDYDEIRNCCRGAGVCSSCWIFMVVACKILDVGLRMDFGYEQLLWVFSGRRGVHCWVADKDARKLVDAGRSCIADYFQVLANGAKCKLPQGKPIHTSIKRALSIIDEYFEERILVEQDILGNDTKLQYFLTHIEDNLKEDFSQAMLQFNTSLDRWKAFQTTFEKLKGDDRVAKNQYLVEEMKLFYSYPRLDANVSKSMGHLLKAPFCVHPKTGKICVPFNPETVDSFNPDKVPTVSQIIEEVHTYKAKNTEAVVEDYKKTSLLGPIVQFKQFIRSIK